MASGQANAQLGKRFYFSGGWQFNGTLSNPVVNSAQGYASYMEGGYYVTPWLAVGGFAGFSSNNEYIGRTTYYFSDQSALTTDLNRSIYQVPFGATVRFRFMRSVFQPYVEAKIGTEYSIQSSYLSTFVNKHDNWGFYISPEFGIAFFPFNHSDFGFQFSVYYAFATNQNDAYGMNGINNIGFKLGTVF